MQTTIVKWGNSQGVRVPRAVLDSVFFKENDRVEILAENGQIVIRKIEQRPVHKTLKQRVEEFYCKDFETVLREESYEYKEIDWGSPVGDEI